MAGSGNGSPAGPGMPRWVKVFLVVGLVAVAVIAVALLSGHGPGRHPGRGAAAAPVAGGLP